MESVAFLLGAGASADAGLPLSRDITRRVIEALSDDFRRSREAAALNFVVAAIIHHDSRSGERPDVLPDIERVASAVELLASRSDLEVTPFVSAWDPTVEALEQAPRQNPPFIERDFLQALQGKTVGRVNGQGPRQLITSLINSVARGRTVSSTFDRDFKRSVAPEPDGRKFVRSLEKFVDVRSGARSTQLFASLLQELIGELEATLRIDSPAACDYLRPLGEIARRVDGGPLLIGTLNYDLGVELMAAHSNCPVGRLIEDWADLGHLRSVSEGIELVKLHGSLDWQRGSKSGGLPASSFAVKDASSDVDEYGARAVPFVVFGQREKLRAEGPFLELLEAYRRDLATRTHLVIIGYGFRDGHINELIARWFNGNDDRKVTIVDPFFPERRSGWGAEGISFSDELRRYSESQTTRTDTGDTIEQVARVAIVREHANTFLAGLNHDDPATTLSTRFDAAAKN